MKRLPLTIGLVALLLTALMPTRGAAAAAQVYLFRNSNQLAHATYITTQGTIVTYATLLANDGYYQAPPIEPRPTSYSYVTVAIYQFDTTCPPSQGNCPLLMYANGFTQVPVFDLSRDLSSATVQDTIQMTDTVSGRSFPLAIDLHWTGYGDVWRNVGQPFKLRNPGIIVTEVGSDYRRRAEVTGSLIDLSTGIDFTAQADDVYGELERAFGNSIRIEIPSRPGSPGA